MYSLMVHICVKSAPYFKPCSLRLFNPTVHSTFKQLNSLFFLRKKTNSLQYLFLCALIWAPTRPEKPGWENLWPKAVKFDATIQSMEQGPTEISPQQNVVDHDAMYQTCKTNFHGLIFLFSAVVS